MYFETHCHLDYLKKYTPDQAVLMANQQSVNKMITISVSPDNLDIVIDLSQKYNHVYCTQGIHPHSAKFFNAEVAQKISDQAKTYSKVVAIGEIGLDYHYNNSEPDIQRNAFEQQLNIACQLDLPVVIHTREAERDTEVILKKFSKHLNKKGVLHSYTSNQQLADFAIDNGFYLGFNGIITFKNAQDVRDRLQRCPIERILVETDAPYLSPHPYRGQENAPFRIPVIVQEIATIKNMELSEVVKQLYLNAHQLFNL